MSITRDQNSFFANLFYPLYGDIFLTERLAVQQVIVNNMAEGEIGWVTDICVLLVQR